MEFPHLYKKVAFLPKRDSSIALAQFTANNGWREKARVIDIGSGDGSTTTTVLAKNLPADYSQIIGCDVSTKMVEYANENYKTDKIEFRKWDITEEIPSRLKGAFDHAFSSYTLQRIPQQKAAFTNIYNALKDGGSCLLLFLGQYPPYTVFLTLSRREKWAKDMTDIADFISPYHESQNYKLKEMSYTTGKVTKAPSAQGWDAWDRSTDLLHLQQDPAAEVTALMESVGFKSIEVNVTENTHTYDDDDTFKNLMKTINPFSGLNKRWDEFMAEYFELAPNARKLNYRLIVAKGVK